MKQELAFIEKLTNLLVSKVGEDKDEIVFDQDIEGPSSESFCLINIDSFDAKQEIKLSQNPKIDVFKVLGRIKKCRNLLDKIPEQYCKNFLTDIDQAEKDIEEVKTQIWDQEDQYKPRLPELSQLQKPSLIDRLKKSKILKETLNNTESAFTYEERLQQIIKKVEGYTDSLEETKVDEESDNSDYYDVENDPDDNLGDEKKYYTYKITFAMLEEKLLKPLDEEEVVIEQQEQDDEPYSINNEGGLRKRTTSMKTDTSRASLSEHKEMSEHMTDQMMGSAVEMKKIARQFGETIRTDTAVIDEIERKQNKNLSKTKKDDDKMKKIAAKESIGFCMRILTLLFSFGMFVFIFIIIRLFPLKIYPTPSV
ncbi:unnamed protein product [Moneuplotes crassus]|uniref:Uncharacterized protein n=1 Tax=Euplotes crassus TaxID=5936 RepID=A0AAD1UM81_EUPCR|nr:unnamed protein product [Moneuplotes crassus]